MDNSKNIICKNIICIDREQYDELIATKKELELIKRYISQLPNYADICPIKKIFFDGTETKDVTETKIDKEPLEVPLW